MGFLKSLFNKTTADEYMQKARRCAESGKHGEALSLCRKAIQRDEACYEAWLVTAAIHSEIDNKDEEALRCYDKALAIISGSISIPLKGSNIFEAISNAGAQAALISKAHVVALNCKGLVLEKLSRAEEALLCYEEMLKTGKADELASSQKARLLKSTGRG